MFGRLLKIAHYVALIGFVGGLATSLVLADLAGNAPPAALAALRHAISAVGETLVIPSLVLLLLSGMLLVVARPRLINARWVWAKAVLAAALAGVALGIVQPAVTRAAALAAEASIGSPSLKAMKQAFSAEWLGTVVSLILVLIAIVLAVWRPRLGRPSDR